MQKVLTTNIIDEGITQFNIDLKEALKIINADSITDLSNISYQIEALKKEGDRLNLKSIRSFVDFEVVLILVFSILALGFSIIAFFRSKK